MRRAAFLAAALLTAAIPMILGLPARGQSTEVISFEDHPAGRDIDSAFYIDRGIRFEGGTVLGYEEGFASSGLNGLEMCFAQEFCNTPFRISFESAQRSVSVLVGFNGRLGEAPPVLMVGFDATGQRLVDSDVVLEPGSPVPVRHLLEVSDPEGRIWAVEIRWSDARRFMNLLVIDDVTFELVFPLVLVSDPSPLVVEAESVGEIVITNDGKGAVSFTVGLADNTGVFALVDTTCVGRLVPGESCTLGVGFSARTPGEYKATAVLLDPNGEELLAVPIIGHEAFVETTTTSPSTTSTTVSSSSTTIAPSSTTTLPVSTTTTATLPVSTSTATASSSTATSATIASTTQARANLTTTGGLAPQVLVTSVVAALGGVFLLAMLRRRRTNTRARHLESRTQINAIVRVVPDQGSHQITTEDRQPVTAIRIATDPGAITTTLMEVK